MKIIINCGGRYKDDKRAHKLLNGYAKYAQEKLLALAGKFHLKLPKDIVLRPLYYRGYFGQSAGRLNYDPGKGYSIALQLDLCKKRVSRGREIIDHECAHLADVLLNKNWEHNESFKRTRVACCKIRKALRMERRDKNAIRGTKNSSRGKRGRRIS